MSFRQAWKKGNWSIMLQELFITRFKYCDYSTFVVLKIYGNLPNSSAVPKYRDNLGANTSPPKRKKKEQILS